MAYISFYSVANSSAFDNACNSQKTKKIIGLDNLKNGSLIGIFIFFVIFCLFYQDQRKSVWRLQQLTRYFLFFRTQVKIYRDVTSLIFHQILFITFKILSNSNLRTGAVNSVEKIVNRSRVLFEKRN
jgi:hypothetical protein